MSVTKKLRFEIFIRDSFQCQYCGKRPPEVILEIDHILPRKRGGKDDPENLITSCFECNRGKRAGNLRILPESIRERTERLKERELQLKEFYKYQEKIKKRIEADIDYLDRKWFSLKGEEDYCFSDLYRRYIKNLLRTFNKYEIEEAMEITWARSYLKESDRFSYMCGILWTWKRRREKKEE